VRATGGLADTVFDANYAERPYHERNGYVFNDYNSGGIESARHRAIGLWYTYPQFFLEPPRPGLPERLRIHPREVTGAGS
jgi:starch synthase